MTRWDQFSLAMCIINCRLLVWDVYGFSFMTEMEVVKLLFWASFPQVLQYIAVLSYLDFGRFMCEPKRSRLSVPPKKRLRQLRAINQRSGWWLNPFVAQVIESERHEKAVRNASMAVAAASFLVTLGRGTKRDDWKSICCRHGNHYPFRTTQMI